MKNPNLVQITRKKEIKFWKRTWLMHKKFNWGGKILIFPPSLILISIGHYCFTLMHFLFECFLWIFMRPQFNANMRKMNF